MLGARPEGSSLASVPGRPLALASAHREHLGRGVELGVEAALVSKLSMGGSARGAALGRPRPRGFYKDTPFHLQGWSLTRLPVQRGSEAPRSQPPGATELEAQGCRPACFLLPGCLLGGVEHRGPGPVKGGASSEPSSHQFRDGFQQNGEPAVRTTEQCEPCAQGWGATALVMPGGMCAPRPLDSPAGLRFLPRRARWPPWQHPHPLPAPRPCPRFCPVAPRSWHGWHRSGHTPGCDRRGPWMRDASSFSAGLGSGSVCEQGVTILCVPPTGLLVSRGSCLLCGQSLMRLGRA